MFADIYFLKFLLKKCKSDEEVISISASVATL